MASSVLSVQPRVGVCRPSVFLRGLKPKVSLKSWGTPHDGGHLGWDPTNSSIFLMSYTASTKNYLRISLHSVILLTLPSISCTSISRWLFLLLLFLTNTIWITVWGPVLLNHTQTDIREIAPALKILQTDLIQTSVNK